MDKLGLREKEVLHLVAAGLTNTQIAERLIIAEETVKTHIRNLMWKLDVHNRASVTMNVYAHAVDRVQREAADRRAERLFVK